jgi:hypothetical protein
MLATDFRDSPHLNVVASGTNTNRQGFASPGTNISTDTSPVTNVSTGTSPGTNVSTDTSPGTNVSTDTSPGTDISTGTSVREGSLSFVKISWLLPYRQVGC